MGLTLVSGLTWGGGGVGGEEERTSLFPFLPPSLPTHPPPPPQPEKPYTQARARRVGKTVMDPSLRWRVMTIRTWPWSKET